MFVICSAPCCFLLDLLLGLARQFLSLQGLHLRVEHSAIGLLLGVLPVVWCYYVYAQAEKSGATCSTDVKGFLLLTVIANAAVNVCQLLERCGSDDVKKLGALAKYVASIVAIGIYLDGLFEVFRTSPAASTPALVNECDAELWHGAYYYILYTFLSIPLACALACCFGCFAMGKVAGAAAKVEQMRADRPAAMV